MNEELKKILKKIDGRVIAFGFKTDKFNSILKSNNKIITLDILDDISKKNKSKTGKTKTITIDKLRKKYKKDKIDYIFINVDAMNKYLLSLIKETIYIGNNKIYLFGEKNLVENTLKKYKRYNIEFITKKFNNNIIIEIDIKDAKNNKIKEFFYTILDKIENIINIFIDVLTS